MHDFRTTLLVCLSCVTVLEYARSNLPSSSYANDETFYHAIYHLIPYINETILSPCHCGGTHKLAEYWVDSFNDIVEWTFQTSLVKHGARTPDSQPFFGCLNPNPLGDDHTPSLATAKTSIVTKIRQDLSNSTLTEKQICQSAFPTCPWNRINSK